MFVLSSINLLHNLRFSWKRQFLGSYTLLLPFLMVYSQTTCLTVSSVHCPVMIYYNIQERICKFPNWQNAPVSGLCVGIFLFAMLRKGKISFPVVSLQNYLLDPFNFSFFAERFFFVLQGAMYFVWSPGIPEILFILYRRTCKGYCVWMFQITEVSSKPAAIYWLNGRKWLNKW